MNGLLAANNKVFDQHPEDCMEFIYYNETA